jgi:iron complex outermembrane receptor protein
LTAGACWCLGGATVDADEGVPAVDLKAVAEMPLEQLLSVPVSVASLRAESFVDAPSSVTVFTRREILAMGVRSVEELLNFVPGMRSVRTASRDAYAVGARGRNSGQLSNDILFLIDGRRLNDDFSGTAVLFNRFLSTGNVRQVEVIRGPGSALYGSNAFVGIVNIVTATDLDEAFVGVGERLAEGYLAVSGGSADYNASLFVSGLDDDGQDYDDPAAPGAGASDPRQALSAFATLETRRLRVDLRHARFRVEDFYVYGTTPANDINEYQSEDTAFAVDYALVEDATSKLNVVGSWRRIDNEGLGEAFSAAEMAALFCGGDSSACPAPLNGGSVARLTEWSIALEGVQRWNDRHQLFAGLSFRSTRFDTLRNQNNYDTLEVIGGVSPPTYYGRVVDGAEIGPEGDARDILSAYVQDRIRLADDLNATVGVRIDHYSDVDTTVNPRAALVYKAAPRSTLKLMYGEAFRAPTVLELELKNSPQTVGNPDLDPEKIRTLEFAWLQEFGRAHVTATGYYSRLEDQIVRAGSTNPFTFENGDSEDLSGVEFELGADLTPALSLRATYAHAFDLAERPRTMPRDTASLILNHRAGRLTGNLNMTWRSSLETDTPAPETLDAALEANINLRYRLGYATLVGSVYNLTDEDVGDFAQTDIPGGSPRRGRSFRVGVEIPF